MLKHIFRGRLLASFQDHEHEGGDIRSQGAIKDNVSRIKIQDHSMQMISKLNSQEQGSKFQESDGTDKVITCSVCEGMLRDGSCLPCNLRAEKLFIRDPNAYSFNDTPSNSNYRPQPQYENYLCNLCGNNSHDGYDCQQQFPFFYDQEPSYNQNYNDNYYPHDSPSFPCCDNCGGSHANFQCQPMDQNIDFSGAKANIEDTILELVEICRQKELYCKHDNVDDLIESALNSKLLSINSQRLNKKKHEVKNVMEQPAELAVAPILSTKEPEYSPSMGYEQPNTTPETELDEIKKSGVKELVPILSENEVTSEDKKECDMLVCENSPICDNHSEIFSDSNNDDDISSNDDDFEDIEYVEASLPDPEITSVEEENVSYHEEEQVDLEDIFQIQDVILREKLLSINRLIANIECLNDNPTPDCVLNSSVSFPISEESNNSLLDNSLPEFETFCNHTKEMRCGNTTTHANNSLPEYDSFCFEIEPDQEKLINVVKNDISDDSTNDSLLEEADLFLAQIIRYHRLLIILVMTRKGTSVFLKNYLSMIQFLFS
nr:hypothetical protein [Tanacetum cinerariifolium]